MRIHPVLLAAAGLTLTSACSNVVGPSGNRNNGAPCGRNQYGNATVTLPDTGIEAGRELQVGFIQHDPDLAGELSEVVIQFTAPGAAIVDPEPVPGVRLVNGAGLVFVDTLGNKSGGRPTWYVLKWIKDAPTRNALFDAFATQTLWLELRKANMPGLGTRVRLNVKEYGVRPPMLCV